MIDWQKSAEINNCSIDKLKARFERFPKSNKKVIAICDNPDCREERKLPFYAYRDLCRTCGTEKARLDDPTIIIRIGKATKKRYENPLEREKTSKAGKKRYKENPVSEETKEKLSNAKLGHEVTEETREKLRQANLGKSHLEETKEKIRLALSGEKCYNWQGGISFDPYCEKFNPSKKREVRNKYNNCDYLTGIHRDICNVMKNGKIQELSVHHFDYNKMQGCNDIPWKLIPVSKSHNSMFNKNKPFWEKLISYSLEYDKEYYKESDKLFNIFEVL